jgi:hypothetical protein
VEVAGEDDQQIVGGGCDLGTQTVGHRPFALLPVHAGAGIDCHHGDRAASLAEGAQPLEQLDHGDAGAAILVGIAPEVAGQQCGAIGGGPGRGHEGRETRLLGDRDLESDADRAAAGQRRAGGLGNEGGAFRGAVDLPDQEHVLAGDERPGARAGLASERRRRWPRSDRSRRRHRSQVRHDPGDRDDDRHAGAMAAVLQAGRHGCARPPGPCHCRVSRTPKKLGLRSGTRASSRGPRLFPASGSGLGRIAT